MNKLEYNFTINKPEMCYDNYGCQDLRYVPCGGKEGQVLTKLKKSYDWVNPTDIITWDNLQNKPFLDIDKTYLSVSDNLLSIKPELIENLQKVSADIIDLKQLNTSLDTRLEIVEKSIEFKDF